MSLPSYLLSSVLLSWIGVGVYLIFRWLRPEVKGQRLMVWLVIVASLVIPLFTALGDMAGTHYHAPEQLHSHQTTVDGFIPPAGVTINEFCDCTEPQTRDVLLYQASRFYDVLLANAELLSAILIFFMLFFFLRHGIGIWKLRRTIKRYPVEKIRIGKHQAHLVRGFEKVSAGCVRLGKAYIFWHPDLDRLSQKEQECILYHELSHLRQFNTYEKIIISILQGIWFFNPTLYFFRKELESLSEFQADEFAARHVNSKRDYAHLLLKVKSNQDLKLAHFFRGATLRKRIERIVKGRPRARLPLIPAAVLGLCLLFCGDLAAQSYITHSIQELEVYEFMAQAHEETGQEEFCKKCTYEIVCE